MSRYGILALAVSCFSLLASGLANAQVTEGYRILPVTFATSNPAHLAINRGRIAWQDDDGNTGLHFLKYFSGAGITTLDSGLTGLTLSLGSDYLVWNSMGEPAKAYDLKMGTSMILGDSFNPDGSQPIAVHDGIAVFARLKGGSGSSIVLHRFSDGTDTTLNAALWNTSPSLHQGQVAWVGADSDGESSPSSIYYYDGRSVAKISGSSQARNRNPIVRDGQVAWLAADSGRTSVMLYTGDTLIAVARIADSVAAVTGYDLSDGIAVAAFTDTLTRAGTVRIYDAEKKTIVTLSDSNGVWGPHISNLLVVWQSGQGIGRLAREYDIGNGTTEDLGAAENPVIDQDMVAWTYGDAVELRRLVWYRKLTTDGMNGWEQTKFKTIDSNRVIWGNFANSLHMRMFAWDGNAVSQLSDSVGDRDLVVANDGYAVWRLDADSLYYSDWVHPPVKFLDSVQAENPYTAGGSIGFFGVKLNTADQVKYPWLYDIEADRLRQLSTDSSNSGNVLCDGSTACWENLTTQRLLFFDGTTTTTVSDSDIVGDYVYRNGLIVWTQEKSGVSQVFAYDVASKSTVQVTSGPEDKYRPVTDGRAMFWFEHASFSGTYVDGDLVYMDHPGGTTVRVPHVPSRTTLWKWMSDGQVAWVGNGNIAVFDGNVISEIADGAGYFLNDAHVDKGYVEWRRLLSLPAQDSGDIFLGRLNPHVAFDARNIAGPAPLAVSFVNRSWEDARSFLWDFGDGTTSSERNPMHAYQVLGIYSVTLTTSGLAGSVVERKYGLVRVTSATGVASGKGVIPEQTALYQNYPNPFNPSTIIKYTVGGNRGQGLGVRDVTLIVYDVLGREVAVLVNEKKQPGTYTVQFDGSALASGVYFYRLKAGSSVQSRKMLIVR
jgi:hypothetical protein